jgi:SAM-dependent methyltransferase
MTKARLVRRRLLDPRPSAVAAASPIRDAVNIPAGQLAARTHELPRSERIVEIADVDDSDRRASEWLVAHGRSAACVRDFELAPDEAGEIGRLWEPNPFLGEVIDRLGGLTALDLACGAGRDAVFLASRGWRVVGVDVLADALQRASALAERCAAAIEPLEWRVIDLETADPRIDGSFDLISAFRYLHRPLVPRLERWLNPGGTLVCETFTTLHRRRHGRPADDAHVLQPGELPELFAAYEIEHYSEDWRGSEHTARLVARRNA